MMVKHCLRSIAVIILLSLTSGCGCFGVAIFTPTECSSDIPLINYTYQKDKWGPIYKKDKNTPDAENFLPSKDDFIRIWGVPDETETISEDELILTYKSKIWCGVVPAYIIPAPLILPTCDGFDQITFKGDMATHIHFKRADGYGLLFPFVAGGATPCPNEANPLTHQKIADE
jgi:hypothetical protein